MTGYAPLPVELAYFTAKTISNHIELIWKTETEVSNYGFDIEKSHNKHNWQTIGFVEGHGNTNSPKDYSYIDNDIFGANEYQYRLKQIDNDGSFEYSDIVSINTGFADNYFLSQNYPNPFNPETRIEFNIPEKQKVRLSVYNLLGELVSELVNEEKDAGNYTIEFDASDLPGGIYFYTIQTGEYTATRKMSLIK